MQTPELFTLLPDYVCTPDGMAVDAEGNLIVSCPNFADTSMPGLLLKIDKDKNISKWVDVPVHPESGCARPMGIAFGPDWDIYVVDNQIFNDDPDIVFKGRILRLRIKDNQVIQTTIVANGMEHPNGIRIWGKHVYVTQSLLTKVHSPSGDVVSCVYRFHLDDENVQVDNTMSDQNILCTFITKNPSDQYGADGLAFDHEGRLYVGNFGDGAVYRITMDAEGNVLENIIWAQNAEELKTTDGMIFDDMGNLYIADFGVNAIVKVTPDATVKRIAQSPDTDGFHGELDQPAEAIIWNGKLIVSCFDLGTGPNRVNTAHEMPATMSQLRLE